MKLYKLTDNLNMTWRKTEWGENITHKASGKGDEMCSDDFIHAYKTSYHAVIFNPIHRKFEEKEMKLWKCEGEVIKEDGMKVGCKKLTTLKLIDIPVISLKRKVEFAYMCALEVLPVIKKYFHGNDIYERLFESFKQYLNGDAVTFSPLIVSERSFFHDRCVQNAILAVRCISNAIITIKYGDIEKFYREFNRNIAESISCVIDATTNLNIIDKNIKKLFLNEV